MGAGGYFPGVKRSRREADHIKLVPSTGKTLPLSTFLKKLKQAYAVFMPSVCLCIPHYKI
jgi:hypothetical protein